MTVLRSLMFAIISGVSCLENSDHLLKGKPLSHRRPSAEPSMKSPSVLDQFGGAAATAWLFAFVRWAERRHHEGCRLTRRAQRRQPVRIFLAEVSTPLTVRSGRIGRMPPGSTGRGVGVSVGTIAALPVAFDRAASPGVEVRTATTPASPVASERWARLGVGVGLGVPLDTKSTWSLKSLSVVRQLARLLNWSPSS